MSAGVIAASGGHPEKPSGQLIRQLGAPVGIGLGAITLRVQQLIAIQEIRENRAYRELDMTWDEYCTEVLGENPHKVEDDLSAASALGGQMFAVAEWAGLKRADFRQLRKGDAAEIRLLQESNELVLGDEVLQIAPENRDRITEAFLDLLQREKAEKEEATGKLAAAEEQLAKGKAQMEAKEEEIEDRENQLKVAANIISVMRHDDPIQTEAGALTVRLAELVTQIEEGDFDKGEAARIYTRISGHLTRLARYAHGAMLDGDAALQRLSPEMRQIILEGEAEDALEGFASEMGPAEGEEGDDA